jgi:tRNA nucleotidyltransferase (CCA-adding enzyme)
MNFIIPTNVSRVTEMLKNAQFEAFLVGGCVRDLLISNSNFSNNSSISARLEKNDHMKHGHQLEQVPEISEVLKTSHALKPTEIKIPAFAGMTTKANVSRLPAQAGEPKDWDITTNAKPEQIVKLFEDNGFKVVYENVFGTVSVVFEDEPLNSSVRDIQITPYRLESAYSDNRHPDSVSFSDTIHDDLSRRDFTMNAIAAFVIPASEPESRVKPQNTWIPDQVRHDTTEIQISETEKLILIDPFHGKQAIEEEMIISVGDAKERFTEDALRIMRAIRFAAQLGFTVSHETMNAISETKELMNNVSAERIRDEFIKIINSDAPAIALFHMKQLGLLEIILPEIIPAIGCEQGGVHIYDVFDHLVHALQHAADKKFPFHIRLAALFHDIGKPKTRRPGHKKAYTFYGHEVVGARIAQKIMERLKFSKAETELVVKFVRWHMFFSDTESITLSAVRRMIANVAPTTTTQYSSPLRGAPLQEEQVTQRIEIPPLIDPVGGSVKPGLSEGRRSTNATTTEHPIWQLMQIRECDRVGMNKTEAPYRLRKYFAMIEECLRDPISVSQLKVDGNYLMNQLHVKPGPRMGWMLHALLEEVLEDPEKNTIEYLSDRVKQFEEMSDAELKKLGEAGKERKEQEEQEEVKKLHVKHGVKK